VATLVLALALAALLGWAGVAKLRAPGGARDRAVAVAELVTAALLVAPPAMRAGGVLAALLGAAFTAWVGRAALAGTRRMACGCFGGTRAHPVSLLLARAVAVLAAGVLVATDAPGALDASAEALLAVAVAVLGLVVTALVVLVLALYRQVGVLERRLGPRSALELAHEGPPLGVPAPPLAGRAGVGSELVAFGSPGCRLCRELEPGLRALADDGQAVVPVREDLAPADFTRWGVPGTPFLVHVVDGVVAAKGLVNTLEQAEGLLATGHARVADVA
jgi:hypothetical protein